MNSHESQGAITSRYPQISKIRHLKSDFFIGNYYTESKLELIELNLQKITGFFGTYSTRKTSNFSLFKK